MVKFVTVKLTSGLTVSGELVKTNTNVVEIKVNTPYFTKHYIDSTCKTIDEYMSNTYSKKVVYRSDAFTLENKKDFTIATIRKTLIESM